MKKLVLFLIVALFTTSSVFSQQRPQRGERLSPEERAKTQTEVLAKELSLSDAQKERIYKINLKYSQPRKQDNNLSREKRREEFSKIFKERTDSIKAVLTSDQKAKFDKHQKKMQERPSGNRPERNNAREKNKNK